LLSNVSGGDGRSTQTRGSAQVTTPTGVSATVSGSHATMTNQSERNQCIEQTRPSVCPSLLGIIPTNGAQCAANLNQACGTPPHSGSSASATRPH
jgi:hypothetical protein